MKRVVVTGGAGFIGANLCRALRRRYADMEVVAFDNLSTGDARNLDGVPDIELVTADILDTEALAQACTRATAVVHLAARPSVPRSITDPVASHLANATGTVNVLEAARAQEVEQVLVASSSSVYGANPSLPKAEGLKPSPMSPYAASKLAAEAYALAWQHSFGIGVLAFRFFNVFGPLQRPGHAYAAVVPAFLDAALHRRPLPVHGDGKQTRDFTFVGSVTSVICDAIDRRVTHPEPVNLAFGSRVSLLALIEEMEAVAGYPLEREHLPPRLGDVRDSQADTSLLTSLFPGVAPASLRVGLEQTSEWLRTGIVPGDAVGTGAPPE